MKAPIWRVRLINNGEIHYKILAVERILQNNPNGLTLNQIVNMVDNYYGLKIERKSFYNYINILTRFMPIQVERKGNKFVYFLER